MKYPELESVTLEFKETFPKNDQIIKSIVGFCNQKGGKLIIGVANDGTIIGVPEDEINAALEYLEKSIFEATTPPLIPLITALRIGDKIILVIEVFPGYQKPYYVKSESIDKGVYIRLGRNTVRASYDMIEELKWQSRGKHFDQLPIYHATINDIDKESVERFLKKSIGKKRQLPEYNKALLDYNLAVTEHGQTYPTNAGILLFGKEPQRQLPESFIICTTFKGFEGRDVLATRDCEGTLIQQYEEALDFVIKQLNRSFTITSSIRDEKLEVPVEALREAILNAIVHRNYNILSTIKIAIYNNRIEIFSPGNFPGPITTDSLKMGFAYARNPSIVRVFRELGYIERLGSGIYTIFSNYEKWQLPEPQILELENFVKCILPRPTPQTRLQKPEFNEATSIMRLFDTATELTISDILLITNIPRTTLGRKLAQLVNDGLIQKIGSGRSTRYIRSKD